MTNAIEADSAYGLSDDQLKKWNQIESDACIDGHHSALMAIIQLTMLSTRDNLGQFSLSSLRSSTLKWFLILQFSYWKV